MTAVRAALLSFLMLSGLAIGGLGHLPSVPGAGPHPRHGRRIPAPARLFPRPNDAAADHHAVDGYGITAAVR